jgi:hypothetical protein
VIAHADWQVLCFVCTDSLLLSLSVETMPFSSLATLELQLIMQDCDLPSLVAFARCCRFTLSSADSEFAWREMKPFKISSCDNEIVSRFSSGHAGLLRHCPVQFFLVDPPGDIRLIEQLPHIVALDILQRLSKEEWIYLMSHTRCKKLKSIHWRFFFDVDFSIPELLLAHLVHLIAVSVDTYSFALFTAEFFDPFTKMRHLKCLSFVKGLQWGSPLAFTPIGLCSWLSELHLSGLQEAELNNLLRSPGLCGLRILDLDNVNAWNKERAIYQPSAVDWGAIFSNLVNLRAIQLGAVLGIDHLLSVLIKQRCPLAKLHVSVSELTDMQDQDWAHSGSQVPSVHLVEQLLKQDPGLQFSLQLPTLSSHLQWYKDSGCDHVALLQSAKQPLIRGFPRATLILQKEPSAQVTVSNGFIVKQSYF